ncbi:MAG: hypothetical protein COC19_05450 [SAR86 cluster bacterium]|uniref:DUF1329 domain-containing protein n=1 Tax=SAR86 cluster bacterium TaxID=2030880 RepID=A0A2A4MMF0_9GAMM|nr:MAG: hypothetical protein COC19_05450 [SAR86 cluster bacterium]
MKTRLSTLAAALTLAISASAQAQEFATPYTSWGAPDLQGNWKHQTVMPFERPRDLGTKQAYTEEEALVLERRAQQAVENNNEPLDPNRPAPKAEALPSVGNYDLFWTDRGMFLPTIDGEFRTSAIIDPPNGRLPARIEGFSQKMTALRASRPDRNSGPEGRGLGERCLVAFGNSSGPVMSPVMYNSHMQIVQSPGYVMIMVEMVHDARIIRIADEHADWADVQDKWMGDSIGRWEGDTLIVETKNYNSWHTYRGAPVDNLTVIETFKRAGNNKIIYGFTVDDPSVYTAQFTGAYPLSRMDEPVYEYACHEGNYGLPGILAGARRLESEGRDPAAR